MGSSLLETIWFSDKRRNLLFLLLEGPKSPEEIKKAFGVNWRSLILPLKELREEGLVLNNDGKYELSDIGELITGSVKPIDNVLNLFEGNTEYWAYRNLSIIPQELRDRIGEISDHKIVEPDLNHMFEPPEQVVDSLKNSGYVHSVFSIYHPLYSPLYFQLAEKGIEVSLVLTESVFERMQEDCREKMDEIQRLQNIELLLYRTETTGIIPPSIVVTDKIFLASFFNLNERYDHRDVMSFSKSSLLWGEELFEYYKVKSNEQSDPGI